MIKSMTGFGNSICLYENTAISIDIKAVNSKIFDLLSKTPSLLKEKELEIRTIISKILERGKIDLTIIIEQGQDIFEYTIDKEKVIAYYKEMENIVSALNIKLPNPSDLISDILKIPDIITTSKCSLSNELWQAIERSIINACNLLNTSRIEEGKSIEKDFITRISLILDYLQQVENFENQRMETVKNRIIKQLSELSQQYDENRFEQEMIYYLEKLDITEEKIRLKTHCTYFLETINDTISNGKKLSFISQEIGREINTLGSKACDVDIQKLVVQMKDELEKIKEQLSNIL
jgi:uncharacterized protein (TIGR00255 family)